MYVISKSLMEDLGKRNMTGYKGILIFMGIVLAVMLIGGLIMWSSFQGL